jgi:hypothetical protein
VAWTSAAKAERAAKQDVARDIAALGSVLRVLVTGSIDPEEESACTLPSNVAQIVARALGEDGEARFCNVAELARALAPCAPSGNGSARTVTFMLSRAGIVGSAIPLPPAARERASLTDEWFARASRRSVLGEALATPPSRRGRVVAVASLALVGFVLGGSWFLWQSGKLPHWTGATPPEQHVETTHVTSAPATPGEPHAVEPSIQVEALPDPVPGPAKMVAPKPAPTGPTLPPPAAPRATPPVSKPSSELRRVDGLETTPGIVIPTPEATAFVEEPAPTPASE